MLSFILFICSAPLVLAVFGPISVDSPVPAGGLIANTQPPLSSFFAGHSPPYPTNDWWVGYGAGSGTAYALIIIFTSTH
jgi:endo-1,3(4)-beta-glucanase